MDIKDLVKVEISNEIKKALASQKPSFDKQVSKYLASKEFKAEINQAMKKAVTYWLKNDYDFIDNLPQSLLDRVHSNALKAIFK